MPLALFENEPLSRHTTWKIGGPARWFARIRDDRDLKEALDLMRSTGVPLAILGGGSNVLVSDEGFPGLVLSMEDKSIELKGTKVVAAAGAILAMVAHKATKAGLTGLEWAYGVPGTVGGAIKGNAGAFGGETAKVIALVEVVDPATSERMHLGANDLSYSYRHSIFFEKPWIITHGIYQLAAEDPEVCAERMRQCLEQKKMSQPLGAACAGSTFRNPHKSKFLDPSLIPAIFAERETVPAAWLIEQVGLKNHIVGGAIFSPKHANFIINMGDATAKDVRTLIEMARRKVRAYFGVMLSEEVRYIGFPDIIQS